MDLLVRQQKELFGGAKDQVSTLPTLPKTLQMIQVQGNHMSIFLRIIFILRTLSKGVTRA
jgi:hypothetical protein